MMRHETKRILLTAATLCAAGCAKSDFQVSQNDRANMRSRNNSATANAPEEKPPKILPETHFAAGMLFERQGQFDKAIHQYRKTVALNHNHVSAYHRLGILQSATGQHLEAAQSLQKAVALHPDNAVLRNDLGFEWMQARQWDNAERELRRAIELQPDLATAHINLAMVQAKSERFTESLASFQEVLPEPDAYYNLGLMFRGQQRYSQAIEAFRQVLAIDPEFSAAKIQLEQLAADTEKLKPATQIVDAPNLEAKHPDAFPKGQGEYAVISRNEWGTTLADLAAILAVLDADAERDCDTPVDRPADDDDSFEGTWDEDFIEGPWIAEFVEEVIPDSLKAGSAEIVADARREAEMRMPSVVVPSDDSIAMIEFKDGEPAATAMEMAEPSAPGDPDSEEVDADDVIADLTAVPITEPTSVRDSWAMLEELEGKVALLRYETQAIRSEKAGFGDWVFWGDAFTTLPTWVEPGVTTRDAESDPDITEDGEFDDDAPFVEIDEDEADEEDRAPSNQIKDAPRMEPAPSDRSSLWTTQFGELNALLSIVRNETVCWDDLDAQTKEALTQADMDWPCVEGFEQAAWSDSAEFSPANFDESDDSMSERDPEFTAVWSRIRDGDVYATQRRDPEALPD